FDGKNMIFDRNQEFWRQLQDYPILESWKNTTGKVLVLFGESDVQTSSKADHEQIVYTVNYFKPDSAEMISFPETDHFLAKSGTRQNAFDLLSQGKVTELYNAFNFEVTEKAVGWALKTVQK
ncbi:MAG TPA: hypothetical protein VFR70_02955, partial [Flavobacterium sp.]|nr:hypothetical protein [Flavobacterium sp.]